MRVLKRLLHWFAIGAFCVATASAQAAVSATTTDASAVPAGTAWPSLTISFDAPYEFIGLDLFISYDPGLLSFNSVASRVTFQGTTYNYGDFMTVLQMLPLAPGYGDFYSSLDSGNLPGEYSFNAGFLELGSTTLEGSILVEAAFDLLPGLVAGTSTQLSINNLAITDASLVRTEFATGDTPMLVTISAVPEPETWLQFLAGLGMLLAAHRRRHW